MSKPRGLIAILVSLSGIFVILGGILFTFSHTVLGLISTLFAIAIGLFALHYEFENHFGKRFRFIAPAVGGLVIIASLLIVVNFENSGVQNDNRLPDTLLVRLDSSQTLKTKQEPPIKFNTQARKQESPKNSVTNIDNRIGIIADTVIINQLPQERKFSEQQYAELINSLKQFSGQSIALQYIIPDQEIDQFVIQFLKIFYYSGVKVTDKIGDFASGTYYGLSIVIKSETEYPTYVPTLKAKLESFGFKVNVLTDQNLAFDNSILKIGYKEH